MKVILNQDVPSLGEVGDIKEVAPGYARNFLLPRALVSPYNKLTASLFDKRKSEIEALKQSKRDASSVLKEKLEAEDLQIHVPAGANGKLYGAVTNATVADELLKKGIEIDRKKIEVPGRSVKSTGNYKVTIRLYEKEEAILRLAVIGQEVKTESKSDPDAPRRRERVMRKREETEPETIEEQAAAFEAAVNAGHFG